VLVADDIQFRDQERSRVRGSQGSPGEQSQEEGGRQAPGEQQTQRNQQQRSDSNEH
jgi:hypothetical protein